MNLQSLFTMVYASPEFVRFGHDIVSRPSNIGAGQWLEFWEPLIREYDDEKDYRQLKKDFYESIEDYHSLEDENDDLRKENDDLISENYLLGEKIEKLNEDIRELMYELERR